MKFEEHKKKEHRFLIKEIKVLFQNMYQLN